MWALTTETITMCSFPAGPRKSVRLRPSPYGTGPRASCAAQADSATREPCMSSFVLSARLSRGFRLRTRRLRLMQPDRSLFVTRPDSVSTDGKACAPIAHDSVHATLRPASLRELPPRKLVQGAAAQRPAYRESSERVCREVRAFPEALAVRFALPPSSGAQLSPLPIVSPASVLALLLHAAPVPSLTLFLTAFHPGSSLQSTLAWRASVRLTPCLVRALAHVRLGLLPGFHRLRVVRCTRRSDPASHPPNRHSPAHLSLSQLSPCSSSPHALLAPCDAPAYSTLSHKLPAPALCAVPHRVQ